VAVFSAAHIAIDLPPLTCEVQSSQVQSYRPERMFAGGLQVQESKADEANTDFHIRVVNFIMRRDCALLYSNSNINTKNVWFSLVQAR